MGLTSLRRARFRVNSQQEVGVGFMFAPNHHPAMKHAAPVRKELGVRTIFNILGPLTNPAGAPNQLLGVFHPDLVGIQVRVLQQLGSAHVLVVHGKDGMDSVDTLYANTRNNPIEDIESHVPLRVMRYELREDVVAAGRWRPG